MGKSVNKVILLGRLGKNPEVRSTAGGTQVAQFSIATDTGYKDKSGEWQKTTEWHNCVAWAKMADVVDKYISKGDQIYVEGRLQTQSWEDKESGQTRYKTEIVVLELCLLGGNREAKDTAPEQRADDITEEEIPF